MALADLDGDGKIRHHLPEAVERASYINETQTPGQVVTVEVLDQW